jgi:hypothetical protein
MTTKKGAKNERMTIGYRQVFLKGTKNAKTGKPHGVSRFDLIDDEGNISGSLYINGKEMPSGLDFVQVKAESEETS